MWPIGLRGGQMPVRVRNLVKLVPLVRLSADRTHGVVVLLNASTDAIAETMVALRINTDRVALLSADGRRRKLVAQPVDDGFRMTLTKIAPWSTTILLIGQVGGASQS